MPEQSFVSVIIPCYNYAHFLEESVGSVIGQTYTNWECLIIDDGSTDDTKAVAAEMMKKDSRVKYYYQQNKGLSAARNLGLSMSKGDYVQFLDADDMIHPQKINEQVEILDYDQTIGVSYTNYQTFKDDLSNLTGRYSHLTLGDHPLEDFLFKWERGLSIPIHAALFSRSVFENYEKPFVEELSAKEDWVMWVQLASDGVSFHFLDKDYCFYRVHSLSQTKDYKEMYSSFMKAVFIILTIVPSSYRKKFVFSSLKHADSTYLDIILNIKANATLFYDIGDNFHPGHALTQSISMQKYFNFSLSYDLSQIGCINQLRFDPLEDHIIKAKLHEINYTSKSGEIKEIDLATVTSNGSLLDNGYTLFQTFDPMFYMPISEELNKITISGAIQVFENQEIEKLLMEKDQSIEEVILGKNQVIAKIKQALAEKEQEVTEVEKALTKREQIIEEIRQASEKKEQENAQVIAEVQQTLSEKKQLVAEVQQALEQKELEKEQVIHRAAEKINLIENELSAQAHEIEQRIQEIEAIINSRSWKITAPLRKISSWFKF